MKILVISQTFEEGNVAIAKGGVGLKGVVVGQVIVVFGDAYLVILDIEVDIILIEESISQKHSVSEVHDFDVSIAPIFDSHLHASLEVGVFVNRIFDVVDIDVEHGKGTESGYCASKEIKLVGEGLLVEFTSVETVMGEL